MEIKVIKREETNPFYNPMKANSGGGYAQPYIEFEFKGAHGTIKDSSCGDFGRRYTIEFNGKVYEINQVDRNGGWYSTFTEPYREFIEAIRERFGYRIYTRNEIEAVYFDAK